MSIEIDSFYCNCNNRVVVVVCRIMAVCSIKHQEEGLLISVLAAKGY